MMEILIYSMAVIAPLIFLTSIYRLRKQVSMDDLITFTDHRAPQGLAENAEYNVMVSKYNNEVNSFTRVADKYRKTNFILSFGVTTLTAGATLLAAINMAIAKTPLLINFRITIIVAIITFVSALTNFAANHFNELRTDALKNVMDWTAKQARFYADYDVAATLEAQKIVIDRHKRDFPDSQADS